MNQKQKYKIDFFEKEIPGDLRDHQINYTGNLSFTTSILPDDLIDKVHHCCSDMAYEGVEIDWIIYNDVNLIEITNFTDSVDIFIETVNSLISGKSEPLELPSDYSLFDDDEIKYVILRPEEQKYS